MACAKCDYNGYVFNSYRRDNEWQDTIEQCAHCQDTKRYSEKVKSVLSSQNEKLEPTPEQKPCLLRSVAPVISLEDVRRERGKYE